MFDPKDFCIVARHCADPVHDEAYHRTAIGRAYYAVFIELSEYTKTWSNPPNITGVKSHIKTIDALKRLGVADTQSIRSRFERLKAMRALADYDVEYSEAEN